MAEEAQAQARCCLPSPPPHPSPASLSLILSIGAFIPSSPRCRPPHEAPWLGGCGLASSSAPPSPGAAGPAPASLRWSHNSSRAKPRTGSGCARRWSACAPPASATCARMPTRPASGTRGCRSLPARLAGRVSGAAVAASSAESCAACAVLPAVPVAADPGAYRRDENTRDLMRLSRPSALACSVKLIEISHLQESMFNMSTLDPRKPLTATNVLTLHRLRHRHRCLYADCAHGGTEERDHSDTQCTCRAKSHLHETDG